MSHKKTYVGLVEHMGDIIACEPVTRYLKDKYPNNELIWVASPIYSELLITNPNVDTFMPVSCLTDWIKISKHNRETSIIVDLHVNYRVCECCRIPLFKTFGNQMVNIYNWYDYGSLLEAFSVGAGLPRLTEQPEVYIQKEHVDKVAGFGLPDHYVVIHRHSNDLARDWNEAGWDILVRQLLKHHSLFVVEVGVSRDAHAEYSNIYNNYIDLRGKTSILETAEVIRKSSLFIGVDSGPAHLANAARSPAVIILGDLGHFKKYTPYTGYYAENSNNVKIVRNPCGTAREVSFNDVYDAVCYILNRPEHLIHINKYNITSKTINSLVASKAPTSDVKVIAFYLPQFHPIPENNDAWGAGFTEWTNIINSQPLFRGHEQPIEPGELGYYDLRNVDIIRQQAELAKSYGIYGFCFYYYYMGGKHLLKTPIGNFFESNIDMPFCILWANHNWTKKWDAGNTEVICEQIHDDFDDVFFIRSLIELFSDERYIKIDGMPVLGVFMPQLFPDINKTTNVWREEVVRYGFPGIYLFMVDDWNGEIFNPKDFGFDATYEMPSNKFGYLPNHKNMVTDINADFTGKIIDYQEFAEEFISRPFPIYTRFKTVMAPWDNTPRYKNRAIVCINTGGDTYRRWLTHACVDTYRRYQSDERIVFLHSWNEWAEGTFVEPDKKNGRGRLLQTNKAIRSADKIVDVLSESENYIGLSGPISELFMLLSDKDESLYRLERKAINSDELTHEINQLKHDINIAQHELYLLYNSRSMKLTKPLRITVKLLKRLLDRSDV